MKRVFDAWDFILDLRVGLFPAIFLVMGALAAHDGAPWMSALLLTIAGVLQEWLHGWKGDRDDNT